MLPGQTRSQLFGTLVVVINVICIVYVRSSLFDVVVYLLSDPLGVDVELPNPKLTLPPSEMMIV